MCKSLLDHYYQDNFIQCNNLRQESIMMVAYSTREFTQLLVKKFMKTRKETSKPWAVI